MTVSLVELEQGQGGEIKTLDGGRDFLRKLGSMGIREGKELVVKARHPFGGPVVIEVDGRQSTIGRSMAGRIILELSSES